MQALRFLTAATILVLLLPSSQAADSNPPSYTETFENDDALGEGGGNGSPSSVTYTFTSTATSTFVNTEQANTGTKSLKSAPSTTGQGSVAFVYTGVNFCEGTPMKFWVRMTALPPTANDIFSASDASNGVAELQVSPTGVITLKGANPGPSTTLPATMPINTWVDFTIYSDFTSGTDLCDNSFHLQKACASSATLSFSLCTAETNVNPNFVADRFRILATGASPFTRAIYADDLGPVKVYSTASENNIFCSNVIEDDTVTGVGDHPNYGYNYRRGGTFFDQEDDDIPGIGLSTGYSFQGDGTEATWDYTAKDFSTGTKAIHANVTLEAAQTSSTINTVFRVNAMTLSGANSDATTKGDGLTTGLFTDHTEAQFVETSNAWQVSFWYVTGGGTRTQLGASASVGSSHDATPFTVWVDNRASALGPANSGFGGGGGTITAGPYIAVTIPQESPGGEDNTIVGFRSLPAEFSEDTIFNVWNVGYGTGGLATTALDENIQVGANTDDEGSAIGNDSTCIFDDVGTAVARGSQGSAPDSSVPDFEAPGAGPDEPTFFNGVTQAALMGFLGIVLAASFAASMNEKTGAGAAGLAIFATMGIWVAYYLNYFGIEVVVALTAGFVAIIFIGIKSAVSGGEP